MELRATARQGMLEEGQGAKRGSPGRSGLARPPPRAEAPPGGGRSEGGRARPPPAPRYTPRRRRHFVPVPASPASGGRSRSVAGPEPVRRAAP